MSIPTLHHRSTPAYGGQAGDSPGRELFRRQGALVPLLILCGMALTLCGIHAGQTLSDTEVLNKVFEYCAQREFQRAAVLLEEARQRSQNEEIYWKLSEIYDSNLHDYARASAVYQDYLRLFPDGRFAAMAGDKLAYLGDRQADWVVLKDYKTILNTYYTRTRDENVALMSDLMDRYPDTSLRPDMLSWLAWEYYLGGRSRLAITTIKEYIASFPGNGKTLNDEIDAYQTYAMILAGMRRYGPAFKVLRDSLADGRFEPSIHESRIAEIRKEQRIWIGLLISIGCLVLGVIAIIILKPWKDKGFYRGLWRMIPAFFLIPAITLVPMWIVIRRGYGTYRSFPALAVGAVVALILVRLLSPLARRVNKATYIITAFILAAACVYVSYYVYDTLCVFYQLPDFNC